MLLRQDLVRDAIQQGALFRTLLGKHAVTLLATYVVADHVATEQIPSKARDSAGTKVSPTQFFAKNRFLALTVNPEAVLSRTTPHFLEEYRKQRLFPHAFWLYFFDTFIVVSICPETAHTEYLIIAPSEGRSQDEATGAMEAVIKITSLTSALAQNPGAQVAASMYVDRLLFYLQTGQARRKIFGIF